MKFFMGHIYSVIDICGVFGQSVFVTYSLCIYHVVAKIYPFTTLGKDDVQCDAT